MKLNRLRRRTGLAAGMVAMGLAVAACGSESGTETQAAGNEGGGDGGGQCETVTLGIIPSWTDGLSTAYLWEHVLTEKGYEVEIEEISDAAPLYTGVANGDIDIYPSAWSEVTHAQYMEEYGDQLEDLGAYYEGAKLTFAVPEYTEIDSIADLPKNVEKFDGKIIGIEPGAGLTQTTKESVMPTYGLDDYTLVESSTTAMLAELDKAIKNQEDIVVTLWKPFWANSEFPIKDLEDPEGALGQPEALHAIATKGFSDECPEVAEMFGNFKLDDEGYGSLENTVVNEFGQGKEREAIDAWIAEHPDFIEGLEG